MAKGYDSLNDTFNTDGSVEVDAIVKADEVTKLMKLKRTMIIQEVIYIHL